MRLLLSSLASALLAMAWSPAASAQQADAQAAPAASADWFRLGLRGGLGVRHDTLTTPAAHIGASGTAVSDLVLDGAWFGRRLPLGVAGRLEMDRFGLRGDGGGDAVAATGLEAMLGLAGRIEPGGGPLRLEGQLGYGFVQAPVAGLPASAGAPPARADDVRAHGPALGILASLAPSDLLSIELAGRALPVTFGGSHHGTAVDVRRLAAGLGASVGRVPVGDFSLSALVGYELGFTTADGSGVEMRQVRHQIAIGVRAMPPIARARVAAVVPVAVPVHARIRGQVRLQGAEAGPLADVGVAVPGGPSARTAADGTFTLDDVPPGLVKVNLSRADLVPSTEVVSVPPGGDVTVQVVLRRAQAPAPAVLIGLVRSDTGAPVAAHVRLLEPSLSVEADGQGRFRFEVPAGRYTLTIEAPGFVTQRKSVRAGAGEQNIYNVDLQAER